MEFNVKVYVFSITILNKLNTYISYLRVKKCHRATNSRYDEIIASQQGDNISHVPTSAASRLRLGTWT